MSKNSKEKKNKSKIPCQIKRVLSVLLILCLITSGLVYFNEVYKVRDAEFHYQKYLDQQEKYDVLFFGNSHMQNDLAPQLLWKYYGITGYDMASYATTIPTTYWLIRLSTEKVKPKMIVMDVYSARLQDKGVATGIAHESLDAFPASKLKREALEDLYGKGAKEIDELMHPFSVYHSRWSSVTATDYLAPFHKSYNKELGATARGEEDTSDLAEASVREDDYLEEATGHIYLKKIIDYCKENHIALVLVNFPFKTVTEEKLKSLNTTRVLAKKNAVPFVDMQNMGLVDWKKDFADGGHLNYKGAVKCTMFLGNYLTDKTSVPTHKGQDVESEFNQGYSEYEAFMQDKFSVNITKLAEEAK